MFYTKGDTPAAPLLVEPLREGDPVDLSLYTAAQAALMQPSGAVVHTTAALLGEEDEDGPAVSVTLPQLDEAGLVEIQLQLTGSGKQDTFTVEPVVVQDLDGWHTLDSAREEAPGLKPLADPRLYVLLETAKGDCITYQPAAGSRRPLVREREAQLVQARNRNAAARIDPASGDAGVDGFSSGPFPMDWAVKALLRPKRRLGAVR